MKGCIGWGLMLCACSGSGGVAGTGGAGGTGGTGGVLTAKGAVTLQIGGPSTTCPEPGNVYPVGESAPSDSDPGSSLSDGEAGISISCSVRGSWPDTFSGSFHAISDDAARDPITITFTNGIINADKTTGTVSVSVFTPQLLASFSSGREPCTVMVINQQVHDGSLWADFSCPALSLPPSALCNSGVAPGVSTLVFENCDGT